VQIHWVGGNLPQIGKAWTARALTENLFERDKRPPLAIDTSPNSPLSQIYNPLLLKFHQPACYFVNDGLAADELLNLAEFYRVLVVKLASHTQATFLNWLTTSGILDTEIEQHFWFVSNGHRDSLTYFSQICQYDTWHIHWVRNHYERTWTDFDEGRMSAIDICDLPGIISNPNEINYIETNYLILRYLISRQCNVINSLTKRRIELFLSQTRQSFLKEGIGKAKVPMPPIASNSIDALEEDSIEY
jgi:hypothetical protein